MDSARRNAEDPLEYDEAWVRNRQKLLNSWAETKHPWSFTDPAHKAFVSVITGKIGAGESHGERLPGLGQSIQVSCAEVGKMILSQFKRDTKTVRAAAPLVRSGKFQSILPTMIVALDRHAPVAPDGQEADAFRAEWVASLFNTLFPSLQIEFLPWKAIGADSRGLAVFNSYVNCMGTSQRRQQITLSQTPTQGESSAISDRLGGAWTVANKSLRDLSSYMFHARLPSDVEYPQAGKEIWTELRGWVNGIRYTPSNLHHHLALIIALFMNRLAPHCQLPSTTRSVTLSGGQTFFDAIRGIPWVPGKRGQPPGGATFGVWYLWILALIEPSSPLRERLNIQNTLGDDLMDTFST